MFSSQSTLNSVGRNAGISTSSNYWYTGDNYPYIKLYPNGSTINTTEIDTTNNILYLGGSFSRLYQHNVNYHSIYDVSSSSFKIKSKNYGTNGSIYAYGLDTSNNILYVGGNFTSVTDNNDITIDASYVAAWSINTQRWTSLGRSKRNGLNGPCNAIAVDISNQEVYVGGNFTKVSDASQIDQSANYVAKWKVSTERWTPLGASDVSYNNGLKSMCRSLAYDSKNTQLYVGGDFTQVRDTRSVDITTNRIAKWDVSNSLWVGMGNISSNGTNYVSATSGRIFASVYDSCKNYVYVSGDFTYVYDSTNIVLSANYIAYWDITNQKWGRLGTASSNGLSGSVYTTFQASTYGSRFSGLAIDSSKQILYVSNLMTSVNDASGTLSNVKFIAAWNINTQRWYRLGGSTTTNNGTSSICGSLAYDSRNNRLHVGGQFGSVYDTSNGTQTVSNIASWDISNNCWLPLGSGLGSSVFSMAMDVSNNYLWVTGAFSQGTDSSGVKTLNSSAYWNFNNSRWYPLGTTAYNGYAFYTNQTSSSILDASNSMFYVTIANSIQAGGTTVPFYDATSTSGLTAYNIAAYNISTSTWQLLGNSTYNGIAGGTMRSIPMFALDTSNSILYLSGNFTSVRDPTNTSQSVNYIAGWNIRTQTWSRLGTSTSNGITNNDNTESNGGAPMAMSVDSSCNLYVGSVGTNVYDASGTLSVNGVASWNSSTQRWRRLGTIASNGLDGSCNAMVLDSSNNRLYVGGNFKKANDTLNTDLSVNCVAYWDITNSLWKTLGGTTRTTNGLDGSCNALAFDSSNNRLYVGGNFRKVHDTSKIDQSANYVAYWDVSNSLWRQIGGYDASKNGVDASVNALAFDSCKNILYVGGNFIKSYDSSFTLRSSLSTEYLASWNPTTQLWSRVGYSSTSTANIYGLSNYCRALIYHPSKSSVYVGGDHTSICDFSNISMDVSNIAYINLNTGNIFPLGSTSRNGTNDKVNSIKLDTINNILYVDGSFTRVVDVSANYIAKYDVSNQSWSRLGSSTSNGLSGMGKALFYDNTNNAVYASGVFTSVRDSSTNDSSKNYNCVAKWDVAKSLWSPLGTHGNGTNGYILAYAYDTANYRVFCGGSFTQVYDNTNTKIYANNVAMYDMNTNTWSAFGSNTDPSNNGINDICRTLVYDQSNTQLYVGGDFTQVRDGRGQDTSANKIAIWKPSESKWYGMGTLGNNGFNTNANRCSVYDSCKNVVYFTGEFSKVYDSSNISGLSVNNIVKWDIATSSFSRLGNENYNGFNSRGDGLAMDTSNQILYVCGLFTTVYDSINTSLNANYIAAWNANTSSWSRLGSSSQNGITSTSPYPFAVLYDSSNSRLYLGGLFTAVSDESGAGLNASYVVYWDILTSRWNRFGSGTGTTDQGVNGRVYDFALNTYNNQLYITGYFTTLQHTSGNISANYIAIWNILTSTWSILGLSNQNGINTTSSGEKDSQLIYDGSNNRVYVCGEFTSVSDSTQSNLSTNRVAYWDIASSKWYRLGDANGNGVGATAKRMALDTSNNYLYVGGNFTTVSSSSSQKDISANYVARWNILTNTWTQLGGTTKITNGVGNAIRTIDLDMSKNLYLGGEFTKVSKTAGDISANYGVIWKPSTNDWSLLGGNGIFNGVTDGSCIALALDPSNQRLYVGGSFTKVRDISNALLSANRIAYWNLNTSTWTGIGTTDASKNGIDGSCNAIVFDSSYTRVYVGGAFRKVSDSVKIDQSVNNVAYWDVSNSIWGKLGASDDSSNNGVRDIVRTLAYDNKNAQLYVGGDFIYARDGRSRDISINRVAIWKPSTKLWSGMGSIYSNGTNGYIYGQVFDSSNNVLYVGGTFTEVYDTSNISLSVNYIATWNIGTKTWSRLVDSSANGTNQVVNCIVLNRTKLHVGGGFTEVYDKTNNPLTNTRNMATWDLTTNTWSRMGGSTWETNGISNAPSSMVIDISNQVLYVACKTSGSNFNIYDSTGSKSVGTIARFNLNSLQWAYLGNSSLNGVGGYYGKVLTNSTAALTFDSSSSSVYCVSYANDAFYYVRDDRGIDISINSVARWDVRLEKWFGLGGHSSNGTNGQINAYAYDGSRNRMYVGGGFTKVYDLSQIWLDVSNVAAWDVAGKYWVRLGSSGARNGVDASVNALAIDSSYSRLYVGGNFKKMSDSSIVDQSANYVVYWDISNSLWGQMGGSTTTTNGLDGSCNALAIDNSNGRVYVGGNFRKVSDSTTVDQSANYVAYWNISTNTWSRLGATDVSYNNGLNQQCRSLVYDPSKTQLYVGGDFTAVRDSRNSDILANRIAIWKPTTSQWSVMGSTANNGLDNSCNALALDSSNNRLYVGGNFKKVSDASQSDQSANYIAYWDLSNSLWFKLGRTDISKNGLDGSCNALIYDNSNNRLYVGGSFKKVSDSSQIDQSANYVAYWDVSNSIWKQLGGTTSTRNGASDIVNALAVDVSKNVFAGGRFISVNDSAYNTYLANYAAFWSPSTQRWSRLGSIVKNGLYGNNNGAATSYTIAIDPSNSVLYGPYSGNYGYFDVSNSSGLTAKSLCAWDIKNECWITLTENKATTINETIFMKYDKVKQRVYMAITNYSAPPVIPDASNGSLYVNGVVYYDIITKKFYPLGEVNNTYATLTNGLFHYTNGAFATVTFARDSYNGNDSTLDIDNSGNLFINSSTTYTGAAYNVVGSSNKIILYRSIVMWDVSNNEWNVLGSNIQNGLDAACYSMVYDNSNQELYMGGNFANTTDTLNDYLPRNFKSPISKFAKWSVKNSRWSNIAGKRFDASNGTNGAIYASVYDSCKNIIYVGGNFTRVSDTSNGDLSANYIAAWDVSCEYWYRLGTIANNGLNTICNALAIDSSKQILYVGGEFNNVFDGTNRDQSANYVAAWNISSQKWSILGASETVNGLDGSCNAMALDSSNNRLYVGGNFLKVSDSTKADQSANYIAYWDISNSLWKKLGANNDSSNNGVKSICRTLLYDNSNSQLYVGGDFTLVRDGSGYDLSVNRIAIWKPLTSKWSAMGTLGQNGTNGEIFAYVYDSCKNVMYVGGNFTTVYDSSNIFGLSVNRIAKWNISTSLWSRLSDSSWNGVDASCNAFAMDTSNQIIYVGGSFTNVYDSSNTNTLTNTQRIAKWNINTSTWSRLGNSTARTNGLTSTGAYCNALVYDNSNSILYVGGNFTTVGDASYADLSANYVAYWNISNSRWFKIGSSDGSYNNGLKSMCRSLAYDSKNNQLYVGGDFTAVRDSRNSDILANRIAIWKPTTSQWSVMGSTANNGLDNSCNAMALDSSNNRLYIGGNFRYANDSSNTNLATNYVAYWDISNSVWKTLGGTTSETNGLNGFCNSLLLGSSNNRLYVGGNFKKVSDSSKSDQSANYVVYWDTSNSLWGQIGGFTSTTNGIDGSVNALAFDSNLNLFVGGNFVNASSTPGDISANKAIIWSTSTNKWINLGVSLPQNGINDGSVNALALDEYNQRLYVGGSFSRVKDSSNILLKSNKVAYWDLNNSFWNALGTTDPSKNGVNFTCRTLNYNSNDTTLYAGGDFTRASDSTGYDFSSNYIAVWKPSTSIWYPLGSFHRNANNGANNSVYTISIPQNNKIFVGGTFTGGYDISGSITSNYGLIWNPSSYKWSKLGGYSKMLNDGTINTLLLDNSFTKLFIGGNFTRMTDNSGNGYNLNDAAIWNINEQSLSSMGSFYLNGLNFYPNVFEMDTNNNVLYMGGNFTYAYNESNSYSSLFSLYVIGYDFTNNKWIQLGNEVLNGVNGEVTGLSIDTTNSILYVSGNYTRVFDNSNVSQSANYIAAYNINTKTWGSLGSSTYNGTNSAVNSILFNSSHSKLYAGGNFTSVYDSSNATLTVKYMAAWNITNSTWSRIGANATYNGVDASINILQYNSSSKYLLTVGNFSNINDSATTKIRQVSNYATYKF